jgi:hypothetical protein
MVMGSLVSLSCGSNINDNLNNKHEEIYYDGMAETMAHPLWHSGKIKIRDCPESSQRNQK